MTDGKTWKQIEIAERQLLQARPSAAAILSPKTDGSASSGASLSVKIVLAVGLGAAAVYVARRFMARA